MYMRVWENPWEGQGTVINQNGGYSSPEDAPGGFWDWWRKNGDTAVDAASDVYCLVFPNSKRCKQPPAYDPSYSPSQQNNTLWYVLIGVILILILVLVLKK